VNIVRLKSSPIGLTTGHILHRRGPAVGYPSEGGSYWRAVAAMSRMEIRVRSRRLARFASSVLAVCVAAKG